MKYILTFLLAILGCAGNTPAPHALTELPVPRLSLSLIGANQMGHACAVSGEILTAGHVAAPKYGGEYMFQSYAWTDGVNGGWLHFEGVSPYRDLGKLHVDKGDVPVSQYRQESPATVGQHVTWYEYNYDPGYVLSVRRRESKIERVQAGHIITGDAPNPGASGSCLFNARNEVIGIVTWNVADSGVSVDLTGQWWPFTEEE
jgi:hypothetical protein